MDLHLGVVGDQGDLAEQVDELLGDPDEVAGGDVLGGEDVLQGVAAGPAVGGVGEAGVELAGQGEAAGLLVGVDLFLELGEGGKGVGDRPGGGERARRQGGPRRRGSR